MNNGLCLLLVLVFSIGSGALRASAAEDRVMVGAGVRSVIIEPDGWKPHVWHDWGAHRILQRHIRQITGIEVPIVSARQMQDEQARQRYDVRIWTGRQPQVNEMIGARLDQLDSDGFMLVAREGDVYLAGRNWWGDSWAVYELLEKYANCRWYLMEPRWWMPQEDGEYGPGDLLPRAEVIRLPGAMEQVEEPDYRSRWFRIAPIHSFRLRQRDRFHHNLVNIMPPSRLFESQPDLYPVIDGKLWKPQREFDFQPRVTNPRTLQMVVDAARAYFDENPEAESFSIGMNDSNRFDNSPQTLALAPASIKDDSQRIAWAFWDWCNRIAIELEKTHPHKRLGCLAYAGLSTLPEGAIKLHPMLVPYLTRDSAQLFDPQEVQEFRQTVDRWSDTATRMGIYEYMYGGGFVIPRIYNRQLFPNIQNHYGVGVDGFYAEAYPNWGLDGPKYWLVSKLLWNARADAAALEDEFHQRMFGPAADVMKRYFHFLEETWCTQSLASTRSNYRWYQDPQQLEIFPPEVCDKAMAMLEEAQTLAHSPQAKAHESLYAGGWTLAQRIGFFKTSFALTDALSRRYHAGKAAQMIGENPQATMSQRIAALESYHAASLVVNERAQAVRQLGFSALSTTAGNELDKLDNYDRLPGSVAMRIVEALVDGARAQMTAISEDQMRTAMDQAIKQMDARGPVAQQLAQDARTRGWLLARKIDQAPAIDGQIEAAVWGQPAFEGAFIQLRGGKDRSLLPASRASGKVTRLWLRHDAEHLYIAAECLQPKESIRTTVSQNDTTHWRDPDMLDDDCIVINVFRQGTVFSQVRVNAAGAWSDFTGENLKVDFTQARVSQSDDGWQVEIQLDRRKLGLVSDQAVREVTISFARYVHPAPVGESAKRLPAAATTLAPYPFAEGFIGAGDHPDLMTFRSGARLLLSSNP